MGENAIQTVKIQEAALIKQMENPRLVEKLVSVLPGGMDANRFVRQAITLVRKNPDLIKADPVTVIGGMVQAAELGLELSGALGQCFLIPRWNNRRKCMEATFQLGYKGYRELAYRSGRIASFQPRFVRAGDTFRYQYGTSPMIHHVPEGADGTDPTNYYCVCFSRDSLSHPDFEVMSREAVMRHRQKFSPAKDRDYSAWASHFDAMALKTVTAMVARRCQLRVQDAAAVAQEEATRPDQPIVLTPTASQVVEDVGLGHFEELPGPDVEEPAAAQG